MKVIDHILKNKDLQFSFEIVPPPRGRSAKDIIEIAEALSPLNPPWIDVTSHASSAYFQENTDGSINKRVFRKRPGTLGICGIIQNRFKIDTVAHVLCQGFTREETEDALIELSYLGIHNLLALRGDGLNFQKEVRKDRSVNAFAVDLVEQVRDLQAGVFLDEISGSTPLDFCIGVAGYPEKHFEAANMKIDLMHLKKKVDAGAEYIVTQMFFDNSKFFSFVKACRDVGITVPIIPGLKVLKSAAQLNSLPKTFHVDLPEAMVDEIHKIPEHAAEIGKQWALKQAQELAEAGHRTIHFYIMNDANFVIDIVKKMKGIS